jgi:glycosyltransferase involved in cell wall biosynthesis
MAGNINDNFDLGVLASAPLTGSRRYIFDMTDMVRIAHSGRKTVLSGIPRVLLLLSYYARLLRPGIVKAGYFDNIHGRYKEIDKDELLLDIEKLKEVLRNDVDYVRQIKYWKHPGGSLKHFYHCFARSLSLHARKFRRGLVQHPPEVSRVLDLRPGDCVVCVGGSWNALELFRYLDEEALLAPGLTSLAVMVPDMIPVQTGGVTGAVPLPQFEYWLRELFRLNAALLTTSDSTLADIRAWCRRNGYPEARTAKFAYGDELMQLNGGDVRDEVRALQAMPYVLMVGPMTGRKNGGNLIRAWRLIANRLGSSKMPALVFAGGEGREHVLQCGLARDEVPWDLLRFVPRPNDVELHHLYKHCLFTVFPSLYEGWGLPIGESLWHGKVCATSNVSSMPEAGGAACAYFDPANPDDMATVLQRLITDQSYLLTRSARIDRRRLRSWRGAAESLLSALDALGSGAALPPLGYDREYASPPAADRH